MVETINPPKTVTTRKEHLCNACHRRFSPGSQMKTQVCKADGAIYSWRTCETCTTLLKEFPNHFVDPVMNCFPDGCVNDAPSSLWGGKLMEKYKKDPTPEHMLTMLREEQQAESV